MIKAIDFFCGAGGLTRGMLDAGISVLAGVDNNSDLRRTYDSNNRPSKLICADIHLVNIDDLRKELGIRKRDCVLYAACTPCQPFSTLNQMQGHDDRKELLLVFAELLRKAPPDYLIVENVPGLNTAYGRDVYERFAKTLEEVGLIHVFKGMLDAKDYGVPQVRKRFILMASRLGPIGPPRRTKKIPNVRDALSRFPAPDGNQETETYHNHVARSLNEQHRRIIAAVPKDGGSRSDIEDESILLPCHQARPKVHKDVFGRMAWEKPAPTLTCRCTDVYCGRFAHPEADRGISLREAAAIQTFPDEYEFYGSSIFNIARQIGNAVPVELAKRLARSVVRSMNSGGG
jgi:DNA (cytosine-5)-methyltransferase 1